MNGLLRLAIPATACAAGVLLAACGATSAPAGSAPVSPASAPAGPAAAPAAPSGAPAAAAPVAAPAAGAAAGTPWCAAAQLTIAYTSNAQIRDGALDGMSKDDSVVTLTNTGAAACRTGGFPGVAALDAAGRQVRQASRAPGAEPVITLRPGQVASALITGNTASCTTVSAVAGLLVTAPDQRTSTRLGPAGSVCLASLQVNSLQPGDSGGLKL